MVWLVARYEIECASNISRVLDRAEWMGTYLKSFTAPWASLSDTVTGVLPTIWTAFTSYVISLCSGERSTPARTHLLGVDRFKHSPSFLTIPNLDRVWYLIYSSDPHAQVWV
jgi:hypothetical protein